MEDKIKIFERESDILNMLKDMLYEKEAHNDSEESINKLKLEIAQQKELIENILRNRDRLNILRNRDHLNILRNRDHVDEEKIKEFIKSLEEKY